MTTSEPAAAGPEPEVPAENVDRRADLLPEEAAVGSDDPRAQAEAILLESEERVADPRAGH
ncbi:hypothetical protein [Nakamurella sp.]|uniref:hypothetical protein n=1 Tax=Nakamurella sp. TaxID=1869182 RepID=UPI003B3B786D